MPTCKLGKGVVLWAGVGLLACVAPFVTAKSLWGKVTGIKGQQVLTFEAEGGSYDLRLYGVELPEPGQPFAQQARARLEALVVGQQVRFRFQYRNDRGELLVKLLLGEGAETDLALQLVREGLAWKQPDVGYKPFSKTQPDLLTAADRAARQAGLGVWSERNPVAPWDYRARQNGR
jgi:endonuclease YncB( thermonuclease family)